MPRSEVGQKISFSIDKSDDETFTRYRFIHAKRNETVARVAADYAHPELAQTIVKLNPSVKDLHGHRLRQTNQKLKHGTRLRVPGIVAAQGTWVHVLADDPPPIVTDGYAYYDTVNVPGRRGVSRFQGYNPYSMNIPVQWENFSDGDGRQIEADIAAIEAMAGVPTRGFAPPVIRISVTDNHGNIVPLIPPPFQWTKSNPNAPEWRITGLSWDQSPLRTQYGTSHTGGDPGGRRVRQKAVITVTEFTPIIVVTRSAAKRSAQRNTGKVQKAKAK